MDKYKKEAKFILALIVIQAVCVTAVVISIVYLILKR